MVGQVLMPTRRAKINASRVVLVVGCLSWAVSGYLLFFLALLTEPALPADVWCDTKVQATVQSVLSQSLRISSAYAPPKSSSAKGSGFYGSNPHTLHPWP